MASGVGVCQDNRDYVFPAEQIREPAGEYPGIPKSRRTVNDVGICNRLTQKAPMPRE